MFTGLRPKAQTSREVDVDGDTSLIEWMRTVGHLRTWSAATSMVRQGESTTSVVLLRAGSVKVVSYAPTGKQVVLALRGPGDLLGEFAALDGRPRSAAVVALTEVEGWVVSSREFLEHLGCRPDIAIELLRVLVSRLREADLHRLESGSLDTTGRIGSLLYALDEQHGPGEWIRSTQADLGDAVGASREATVKALRRLREAGIIETARSRVRVVRAAPLGRLAAGEPLDCIDGTFDR